MRWRGLAGVVLGFGAAWVATLPLPAQASCSTITSQHMGAPAQPCPTPKVQPAAPHRSAPAQQHAVAPSSSGHSNVETLNGVANVLSGVGDLMQGMQALNPPAGGVPEPAYVEQPPDNPRACTETEREHGCRGLRRSFDDPTMDAADFSGQIRPDDTYEVDLADKSKKRPVTRCDERGCWIDYVSVAPTRAPPPPPPPRVGPDPRLVAQARKDLDFLKHSAVPRSEYRTALLSKYPADVVDAAMR